MVFLRKNQELKCFGSLKYLRKVEISRHFWRVQKNVEKGQRQLDGLGSFKYGQICEIQGLLPMPKIPSLQLITVPKTVPLKSTRLRHFALNGFCRILFCKMLRDVLGRGIIP